jgi:hypothetical protein
MYSLQELRDRIFGSGVGLKTQMADCSFDQLEFQDAGGLEITLPRNMAYYTNSSLIRAGAEQAILNLHKVTPDKLADKVMFCQPPGSGGWLANAGVNHWMSQYNNEWCLSLSANMHEIGHNLGLLHSSDYENPNVEYSDTSGYMVSQTVCVL